jgi:RimJ/RimL family protein N-acetyltransferase
MIESARLVLRPFRDEDRPAMAEINGHPEVGAWLGQVRDRAGSDAWIDKVNADIARQGFGFWAAERKADQRVIGAIGILRMTDDLPAAGALRVGLAASPPRSGSGAGD